MISAPQLHSAKLGRVGAGGKSSSRRESAGAPIGPGSRPASGEAEARAAPGQQRCAAADRRGRALLAPFTAACGGANSANGRAVRGMPDLVSTGVVLAAPRGNRSAMQLLPEAVEPRAAASRASCATRCTRRLFARAVEICAACPAGTMSPQAQALTWTTRP